MRSDTEFEAYFDAACEYLWDEVEPYADEWDRTGDLPRAELWEEFSALGFLGARVPEAYGGFDLSQREYVELEKVWAKVSGGLRVILHVHNLGAELVRNAGTAEQRESLLPDIASGELSVAFALTEPHAGTGRDIKTAAERDGDAYVLTGQKHLITNADFTDLINVVTHTESGISNLLVPRDTPGLISREMPETMGSHGSHHAYLEFNECEVPVENILGEEGRGLVDAIDALRVSRLYIAANALGISERCFEAALDWAKRRVTFGKPIAERQAVQGYLAEMARDVYTLGLVVDDVAAKADAGTMGVEAELAKLLAMDVNRRVTDTALLVFGGIGYSRETPIHRLYRDARLNWLEEGTPTIQKTTAAANLLDGVLPYEPSRFAEREYNLTSYDPEAGDAYTLSYE